MTAAPLGPGDLQTVFQALKDSLSQNTVVQKQAESLLHSLETRPGFCSCLAVSGPTLPASSCTASPGRSEQP